MPETKAFRALKRAVAKEYLGKGVPKKYQARYGKKYDINETKSIAYAIAQSKGIKRHRKK